MEGAKISLPPKRVSLLQPIQILASSASRPLTPVHRDSLRGAVDAVPSRCLCGRLGVGRAVTGSILPSIAYNMYENADNLPRHSDSMQRPSCILRPRMANPRADGDEPSRRNRLLPLGSSKAIADRPGSGC
jgi:hypothetical protein